jgi:formylglycine-generating enzyme required for sulfatase activity
MPIHRTARGLGLIVLTLWVIGYLILPVSMRAQAQAATASGRVTDAPDGKHVKSVVNPKDGLTYVWIPAGTFQMGCSQDDTACGKPEKPSHMVTLSKGFWIGQTEVTQAAYKKVKGSNPSHYQGDQLPVEAISWDDAKAYCEGIDMRLPTEAEYEYAARGGNPSRLYGPIDQVSWYGENSTATHEVGQKQPNGYGLYDMMGNVFAWVGDWYGPYDAASVIDPKGPTSGQYRVYRGATWTSLALGVRVSYRGRAMPGENFSNSPRNAVGIRCVAHKDLETVGK